MDARRVRGRPVSRLALAGAAANAAALACVVVAFLEHDDGVIEGAYFNRAVGADEAVLVSSAGTPWWLAAAAALIVLGTAALVLAARRDLRRDARG